MLARQIDAAAADEAIYKGKRLTVLVNFAAGGPTARLVVARIAIGPATCALARTEAATEAAP